MSALPPKADMCRALIHVRYGPKADISRKRVSSQLFDNFVSDRKHTRWNGQPQGWLKHKLEFSSLAHRHIGGPFIFKNLLWGLTPHWRGEYGRGLGPRRPSFAHRAGPAIMGLWLSSFRRTRFCFSGNYFLMRQVDRDVLPLRVALEHPFE